MLRKAWSISSSDDSASVNLNWLYGMGTLIYGMGTLICGIGTLIYGTGTCAGFCIGGSSFYSSIL